LRRYNTIEQIKDVACIQIGIDYLLIIWLLKYSINYLVIVK